MPPCAVKTCAVHPVFARVVGELRAADPSNVQRPVKQNASPGEQSEAPRPRWKLGQEQNPGPENQDSQHMMEQPRGSFPEFLAHVCLTNRGSKSPIRPMFCLLYNTRAKGVTQRVYLGSDGGGSRSCGGRPQGIFEGGVYMREVGTMWQICVLTGKPCTFLV